MTKSSNVPLECGKEDAQSNVSTATCCKVTLLTLTPLSSQQSPWAECGGKGGKGVASISEFRIIGSDRFSCPFLLTYRTGDCPTAIWKKLFPPATRSHKAPLFHHLFLPSVSHHNPTVAVIPLVRSLWSWPPDQLQCSLHCGSSAPALLSPRAPEALL